MRLSDANTIGIGIDPTPAEEGKARVVKAVGEAAAALENLAAKGPSVGKKIASGMGEAERAADSLRRQTESLRREYETFKRLEADRRSFDRPPPPPIIPPRPPNDDELRRARDAARAAKEEARLAREAAEAQRQNIGAAKLFGGATPVKPTAVSERAAREEANAHKIAEKAAQDHAKAILQLNASDTSGLARFGQMMRGNSQVLTSVGMLFGPLQAQILRFAAGMGLAAAASERFRDRQAQSPQSVKALADALLRQEAAEKALSVARAAHLNALDVMNKAHVVTAEHLQNVWQATGKVAAAENEAANAAKAVEVASQGAAGGVRAFMATILPLVIALVALAAIVTAFVVAYKLMAAAIQSGREWTVLKERLTSVAGTSKLAREELDRLRQIKLGQEFTMPELVEAAVRLHAVGLEGKALGDVMEQLATAALATGQKATQGLAEQFVAIERQGNVTLEQVSALRDAGLNLIPELQKASGRSGVAFAMALQAGLITAKEFQAALKEATTGSGRYADLAADHAKSLDGVIQKIKDRWEALKQDFGEPIAGALAEALDAFDEWFGRVTGGDGARNLGEQVADIIREGIQAAKDGNLLQWLQQEFDKAIQYLGTIISQSETWRGLEKALDSAADKFIQKIKDGFTPDLLKGISGAGNTGWLNTILIGWGLRSVPTTDTHRLNIDRQNQTGPRFEPNLPSKEPVPPDQLNDEQQREITRIQNEVDGIKAQQSHAGSGVGSSQTAAAISDIQRFTDLLERFKGVASDNAAIAGMAAQIKAWNDAVKAGIMPTEEFDRRVADLKNKTAAGLIDPANAGKWEKVWETSLDDAVNAHRKAMAEIEVRHREMEDKLKSGSATAADSFIFGMQRAAKSYGTFDQQLANLGGQITDTLGNGISTALGDIVTGTKSASNAFKDMAVSILNDISRMIIKMLVLRAVQELIGMIPGGASGGTHGGAGLVGAMVTSSINAGMASGGSVRGGRGGIDDIPIMATAGEFMIQKDAARNAGEENLRALNEGRAKIVKRYGAGGAIWNPNKAGGGAPYFNDDRQMANADFYHSRIATSFRDAADSPRLTPPPPPMDFIEPTQPLGGIDIPPADPANPYGPDINWSAPRRPTTPSYDPVTIYRGAPGDRGIQGWWTNPVASQFSDNSWNPQNAGQPTNFQVITASGSTSYTGGTDSGADISAGAGYVAPTTQQAIQTYANNLPRGTNYGAGSTFSGFATPAGMTVIGFDQQNGAPIYQDASGNRFVQPGTGVNVLTGNYANFGGVGSGVRGTTGSSIFDSHAAGLAEMGFQAFGGNPNFVPNDREANPLFYNQRGSHMVMDADGGWSKTQNAGANRQWVTPSQAESARLGLSFDVNKYNAWIVAHNQLPIYHEGGIVGMANGGLVRERAILARDGEGVFTPEQMSRLAPSGGGGGSSKTQQNSIHLELHVHQDGSTTGSSRGHSDEDNEESGRALLERMRGVVLDETRRGGIIDRWGETKAR